MSRPQNLTAGERRGLPAFIQRYPLVHLVVGLAGNLLFVIGSLLYVLDFTHVGRYFFLTGSSTMFLGTLGEVVRILGRRVLREHHVDPPTGQATAGGGNPADDRHDDGPARRLRQHAGASAAE